MEEAWEEASASYTPYYCEENVYNLLHLIHRQKLAGESYAIFISNEAQQSLLFNQKISQRPDQSNWVIWDYHVVALTRMSPEQEFVIWDRDSLLDSPISFSRWIASTFSPATPPDYKSSFRIVPSSFFLAYFSSDRSHMLPTTNTISNSSSSSSVSSHSAPNPPLSVTMPTPRPPQYPPIRGEKARTKHELFEKYISMVQVEGEREYGQVFEFELFCERPEKCLQTVRAHGWVE
ncbi:hypothetical protein BT69DRAFT_694883 [Atractiella rhizophila]|nr:hypothetical protein BT69DRAFT_694883 [Atractiella rhizophila]